MTLALTYLGLALLGSLLVVVGLELHRSERLPGAQVHLTRLHGAPREVSTRWLEWKRMRAANGHDEGKR